MTKKLLPLEPASDSTGGLGRREVIQMLFGAAGAGVALPHVAEGHPLRHHLGDLTQVAEADAKARKRETGFLDAHQLETLRSLAERILPGAGRANTAEFIDQLLAVDTNENRRRFLTALGAFEGRALERAGRPWKELSPADQEAILTEASTAASGRPREEPWTRGKPIGPRTEPPPARLTLRDHFDFLKGWIAGAYYSSEIGMRELGWTGNVFHQSFPGCPHPEGHR
ncbi:MAG TPA: gluconate 2-dehydrogenase subunit 3 family protein [Vicinamibacterales bacterium]|nr:gluconate 2-dehydrogenase subunit 3 family protein [Vicinamibacterales bacterium]